MAAPVQAQQKGKGHKSTQPSVSVLPSPGAAAPAAVIAKMSEGDLTIYGPSTSTTIWVSHHGPTTDVYAVSGHVTDAGAMLVAYETPANKVGTFVLNNSSNVTVNTGNGDDFIVLTIDDSKTLPDDYKSGVPVCRAGTRKPVSGGL